MLDELYSFDLNLLVIFITLMKERNVTACAEKLKLGQPAVSGALRRLRDSLGDQLFVRSGGQMRPTEKAIEIATLVGPALELISAALVSKQPFCPNSCQEKFSISVSGGVSTSSVTGFIKSLLDSAPCISISVDQIDPNSPADNRFNKSSSLEIGYFANKITGATSESLLHCRPVLVRSKESKPVTTLKELAQRQHVLVPFGNGREMVIDQVLAQQGLLRNIAVKLTSAAGIEHVIPQTELVTILPDFESVRLNALDTLLVEELPDKISFDFALQMAWARVVGMTAADIWFREQIRLSMAKVSLPSSRI